MTTAYKKKLIEVAMPLEAINAASAREKSIRHGHPSTLHLWWARRPLAACRAVLFAQLVDDPSALPGQFPTLEDQDRERKRLFAIIERLVTWENSTNEAVLEEARAEIRKSCNGELPPVYDPFSGGGSIPLEAQRLGLPAYGSDLNPVAVMIGKAMIEIPPKFKGMGPIHPGPNMRSIYRNAEGLAEDVRYYGEWMREKAFERIGHLYPKIDLPEEHGDGQARVIAWIWSRTVPSPDPAFSDVQVPIASSFMLSTKKGKEAWIEPIVDRSAKTIKYQIRTQGDKDEIERAKKGTKSGRGAHFNCLLSDSAITPQYTKEAGSSGRMGQTLIAVVAEGNPGRIFVEPPIEHARIAQSSDPSWKPDTKLPGDLRAFWTPPYGLTTFGDLFTDRQLVALNTFSELIEEARSLIEQDASPDLGDADQSSLSEGGKGAKAYSEAVSVYLAFCVSKSADYWSNICTWRSDPKNLGIGHVFSRQAIPMAWDYAEANPFSKSSGNFLVSLDWIARSTAALPANIEGNIQQLDAQVQDISTDKIICTDPPYYDNIGYADLSDFLYIWVRPLLRSVFPDVLGLLVTPKSEELVAVPYRHDGKAAAENFFLEGMRKAIAALAVQSTDEYPATIFYAFKQSEIAQEGVSSTGWATFLQAVLEAGYSVVGTWPMRTEMANRMIASGTNALANSVVLVCRKKEARAETIARAEFIRALKHELPQAIAELQAANIAPADMPQSAIGPGMGVFSRYKAVLENDDSPMSVKSALQLINRELDEYLGGLEGEFDAETRFAVTWYEQNGYAAGEFGPANSLANARGISVDSVKHAGIVESGAGKVRILKREELLEDWTPESDAHLTQWECLQYLVRAMEGEGERAAAILLRRIGPARAETVKDLAYRLYDIAANKRKEAKEATAYNSLIALWTDLTRDAAALTSADLSGDGQGALFN
jgi:putative DNA methylase